MGCRSEIIKPGLDISLPQYRSRSTGLLQKISRNNNLISIYLAEQPVLKMDLVHISKLYRTCNSLSSNCFYRL